MSLNDLTNAIFVLSIISIIVGLLLSGSGSSAGLTALNGHDLELFKKTKDRGFIKIMQIIFIIIIFTVLILIIINKIYNLTTAPVSSDTEETTQSIIYILC